MLVLIVPIAGLEQRRLRNLAQKVLHLEHLENLTLLLQQQDGNTSLVDLTTALSCIFVLSKCVEYLLYLELLPLAVDLRYEAHLVVLHSPVAQELQLEELLVLALYCVLDGADACAAAGLLEPVVHQGGQVDVVSKHTLASVKLTLLCLVGTET